MKKITNIMILAAGLGKRMKYYTKKKPKPLIKIDKETLIEKIIKNLEMNDFKKIVINIFYLKKKIKDLLNNKFKIKILFSDEKNLLDTGGGIKNALKLINSEEFFVINSDIILDIKENPFVQLEKFWNKDKMDALLLLYPKGKNKGDFNLDSSNRILIDKRNLEYVFTGIQILKSNIFLKIKKKKFSLSILYEKLIKKKKIFGIVYTGNWYHIGTLESLKDYKKMIL
tara:strand:- start:9065 stop:9745 length:681 start_codon:yes stop_codon:yes gene_type:complete